MWQGVHKICIKYLFYSILVFDSQYKLHWAWIEVKKIFYKEKVLFFQLILIKYVMALDRRSVGAHGWTFSRTFFRMFGWTLG